MRLLSLPSGRGEEAETEEGGREREREKLTPVLCLVLSCLVLSCLVVVVVVVVVVVFVVVVVWCSVLGTGSWCVHRRKLLL